MNDWARLSSYFAGSALLLVLHQIALAFFRWLDRRLALTPQQRAGDFWDGWRLGLLVWFVDRRWTIIMWVASILCLLVILFLVVSNREEHREELQLQQQALHDKELQELRDQPDVVITAPRRAGRPTVVQPSSREPPH